MPKIEQTITKYGIYTISPKTGKEYLLWGDFNTYDKAQNLINFQDYNNQVDEEGNPMWPYGVYVKPYPMKVLCSSLEPMIWTKEYKLNISGSGNREEIARSLRQLADSFDGNGAAADADSYLDGLNWEWEDGNHNMSVKVKAKE